MAQLSPSFFLLLSLNVPNLRCLYFVSFTVVILSFFQLILSILLLPATMSLSHSGGQPGGQHSKYPLQVGGQHNQASQQVGGQHSQAPLQDGGATQDHQVGGQEKRSGRVLTKRDLTLAFFVDSLGVRPHLLARIGGELYSVG